MFKSVFEYLMILHKLPDFFCLVEHLELRLQQPVYPHRLLGRFSRVCPERLQLASLPTSPRRIPRFSPVMRQYHWRGKRILSPACVFLKCQ